MDKLTKRALQAQVEAAVRLLRSNGLRDPLPEKPARMLIGKTATRSSRKKVSSLLPASRPKPATYVPALAPRNRSHLTNSPVLAHTRRRPTQKRIPLSQPPKLSPSAHASKLRRKHTRRGSLPRQKRERSASRLARMRMSKTRSRRRWAAGARRSRALPRSATRLSLSRPRPWASRLPPWLDWRLV
jgi:hypothetical protein